MHCKSKKQTITLKESKDKKTRTRKQKQAKTKQVNIKRLNPFRISYPSPPPPLFAPLDQIISHTSQSSSSVTGRTIQCKRAHASH